MISASLVETLIHNLSGHTLLKDVKSNKYLDANADHLSIYGLNNPADIRGQTIWDLDCIMNAKWGKNAREMQLIDNQVAQTGIAITKQKRLWLNAEGFVWVHYMNKFPIIGRNNNITAILSFGEDLTNSLSLKELYGHYCQLYGNHKSAIIKFLEHIKVRSLFNEYPTHAEILVLIAKVTLYTNKLIATELNIKLSTVETHINHLNQKTQNLNFVIEFLRKL